MIKLLNASLAKGPGGPVSVAKTILRFYNSYLLSNPGCTLESALRESFTSRYQVFRKKSGEEVDTYVSMAENIGDIITICIYLDIPMAFSSDMFDHTFYELRKFYSKNFPEGTDSVMRVPSLLRQVITTKEHHCW